MVCRVDNLSCFIVIYKQSVCRYDPIQCRLLLVYTVDHTAEQRQIQTVDTNDLAGRIESGNDVHSNLIVHIAVDGHQDNLVANIVVQIAAVILKFLVEGLGQRDLNDLIGYALSVYCVCNGFPILLRFGTVPHKVIVGEGYQLERYPKG